MNYWLVKQEPSQYNWEQFVKDKETYWDGVRNFQARNNLKAMKKGDLAFFYHSVSEKQVVGVARVSGESYPDPTASDPRWVVADLKAVKTLKNPVSLADIKSHPKLQEIALVKQSRLSVLPLTQSEFETILKMGDTRM